MIYEIKDITFHYFSSPRKILDRLCLSVEEGQILTILGPNGAGKSTLLNCMAGLLKPDSGEIYLCGQKMSGMSFRDIARNVGYVQQTHTPAFAYTVLHFVTMGCAPRIGLFGKPKEEDQEAAWNALEILGITHLATKPYTEISGGERQQAMIARAIVQEPKVILFDEPTAHLDYGNQLRVLRLIKNMAVRGYSVVMTTHNPDHAMLLGGTVAVLDKAGRLVSGLCTEIITEERLEAIYNTRLHLLPVPQLERLACIPPKL